MLLDTILKMNLEIENEWRYVNQVINPETEDKNHCFHSNLFDDYAVFTSAPQRNDNESKRIWGKHGIYIFLFSDDIEITKEQIDLYNSLNGAKLKKDYFSKDGSALYIKDCCLYTGSCINKSLYVRLREHFGENKPSHSASLHIESKERCFLKGKIIAYAFPVKAQFEDHLRVIIPGLEYQMHNQFEPMAGSPKI